jgi:hypothetical protein
VEITMLRLVSKLAVLLAMSLAVGAEAEVSFKAGGDLSNGVRTTPMVTISGEITPSDPILLSKTIQTLRQDAMRNGGMMIRNGVDFLPLNVVLNSLGGDVEAALAMGHILRDHEATVIIQPNGQCVSACVFLLAGGISRHVLGRVGIHRPYLPNDKETTALGQRQRYERFGKVINTYLEAMNVPTELYERMLRIAPEKVHWLTKTELQAYGLSSDDPYAEEARSSREAAMFGLNKREFLKARQQAERVCTMADTRGYAECFSRVIREARDLSKK